MTPSRWPAGLETSVHALKGGHTFVARTPDGRLTYHGVGSDDATAEQAAWASYHLANDPGHEHDFDPGQRQDGFGQCRGCSMSDTQAFEQRRTIDHGRYALAHPWPAGWHVQGGASGLVIRRSGGTYTTAFVEVAPTDPQTFIRGEGATLVEAEQAAWEQAQRTLACPGHEFETRGYTNGAGFCRHCNMFASGAFDVAVVGNPCVTCGARTNWTRVAGAWYCQDHAPDRAERARLRAEAPDDGAGDSPLRELLEAMLVDDDD
ncbi:hypothetical protein [Pseudactinotalea terrae]|uniref:hypothetical protein n=1 Tax=Pseudactinotalea terrae TaxID=1743262 RepID=UPI0012E24EA7|nr:hypothetical protein [Pseudactinotalea terrae]